MLTMLKNSKIAQLPLDKWLTIAVLISLLYSLYSGWNWPFGILFLYWIIPSIATGQTMLILPLDREMEPILFWIVAVMWSATGAMMILIDIFPQYFYAMYM